MRLNYLFQSHSVHYIPFSVPKKGYFLNITFINVL